MHPYKLADMKGWIPALLLVCLVGGVSSCGTDVDSPEGVDDLLVTAWGPATVLVGTPIFFEGQGFIPSQLGDMTIHLEGICGNKNIVHDDMLEYVDDQTGVWRVTSDFGVHTVVREEPFVGTVRITRKVQGYSATQTVTLAVTIYAERNLVPVVNGVAPDGLYLGDELQVQGANLLTIEEGQTLLFLDGEYQVQSPPMVKEVHNVVIPLAVEGRNRGLLTLTPDKFGIYPGDFAGTGTLHNIVEGAETASSEEAPLSFHVYRPKIEDFSPDIVRRGQKVRVNGRGFVATDPVGETATLVLLEGVFTAANGKEISYQGKDAMLLFPEEFAGNEFMEVVLRVTMGVDGSLTGLGLIPGTFVGKASPQLFFSSESFVGDSLDFSLVVAPQLQVVYVKYLPSFAESFHEFGLYAVRDEIQERIIFWANQFYTPFNVTFVSERPEDYVEYSVIELSGKDPNGANLLGLDNTTGKDINNLRFNDVVGGKNAETEERGYYAYGGVFLESFLMFSPSISNGTTSLANSRFDDVFGPFVPQLSGNPVETGEYPGGSRDTLIAEAIRVVGNLLGGTVAHEIGHSLGLAMVPGHPEEYHNLGDNPKWLMDAGNFRPFVERADVDGAGPEEFSYYNYEYLQEILPKG